MGANSKLKDCQTAPRVFIP